MRSESLTFEPGEIEGGEGLVSTGPLSLHAETNRQLIEQVTGQQITAIETQDRVLLSLGTPAYQP